ncbi:MAG: SIS domain-containing protein [Planctomycetota bacterium]|nr:SIS domain-containing protein [Planctomycetota bacterium]MDA1262061.1 SIS domain-containing protein [Planctomycetota bacterium]
MSPSARTAEVCIQHRLEQAKVGLQKLAAMQPELNALIKLVRHALADGKMILTCGNGGSAAEALHLSEELIGRYRSSRAPLKSICLCADTTALTCIGNDFGFDHIYSRQVEALASKGDLLIVLSTSGNSPNILRALEAAKSRGTGTIGLLGADGGKARTLCDLSLVVTGVDGSAVQEIHQMIIHILCETLEPS